MDTQVKSTEFREGMMVSELRQNSSISFINTLRENDLITINRRGKIHLTPRGKVASKLGISNYLRMEQAERQILDDEFQNLKVESRGLFMIFGGMFISLILIIGFWVLELQSL